jgi:adenine-specific DNA-methyltransferase
VARGGKPKEPKAVTRYTYEDVGDPATPETGHTPLIADELVVRLDMDNGWTKALEVGRLPDDDVPVIVDVDPAVDPVLMWAGKRSRRDVPVLPLQRTEIISESRIARIVERARQAAAAIHPEFPQGSLFADLEKDLRESSKEQRVEFYTHNEGWKNKLICGDSLPVMESLLHYEGLRGKVQMIYIDPPYGIDYNSNFQQRVDRTENDQKDRADDVIAIKAFRDTWALGVHSYLEYLKERLYLGRELLADSGSIFIQMNVENEHLVRSLMDEVFGARNFYASIAFNKTTGFTSNRLSSVYDLLLWYGKDLQQLRYHQLYQRKSIGLEGSGVYNRLELPDGTRRRLTREELENIGRLPAGWRVYTQGDMSSQGAASKPQPFEFEGSVYHPSPNSHWKAHYPDGMQKLAALRRIEVSGKSLRYVRFHDDMPLSPISNIWMDTGTGSFTETKVYAVQTNTKVVERCIAMATDPGDLVLDPTCGSGTTALAAERLGRRWVTCDTSRVAMNVARRRLLSAVLEHYRLAGDAVSDGFLCESVDRVTLKSLAYDQEPERIELVDRPIVDPSAMRVFGPLEILTLGRYSLEEWRGQLATPRGDDLMLEDYIAVICRLYRAKASLVRSTGLIHAVEESEGAGSFGISVGPMTGRVTARQLDEAAREAVAMGLSEVDVLGWAFEANVGEVKQSLEHELGVRIALAMIRPDTLAEGLKATQPGMLFSPLALPDVQVERIDAKEREVTLKGVAVFDRKRRLTEYKEAGSGYIAAWYLDEDYDGDCFVDCQMFFDFKKKPSIEATLKIVVDPLEWSLRSTSDPFEARRYGRAAVKVVDVFGNESTVIKDLK